MKTNLLKVKCTFLFLFLTSTLSFGQDKWNINMENGTFLFHAGFTSSIPYGSFVRNFNNEIEDIETTLKSNEKFSGDFSARLGYKFGVYYQINLNNKFDASIGLGCTNYNFIQKLNYQLFDPNVQYDNVYDSKIAYHFHYLTLPTTINYRLSDQFRLQADVEINFKLATKAKTTAKTLTYINEELEDESSEIDINSIEDAQKLMLSYKLSAIYKINNYISLNGGIQNTGKLAVFDDNALRIFALVLSIQIKLDAISNKINF